MNQNYAHAANTEIKKYFFVIFSKYFEEILEKCKITFRDDVNIS